MNTKKSTTKTPKEKSDDPHDPYNTPTGRAEALKELEGFHQLYPSTVINAMRETILDHVAEKLKAAGEKETSELIHSEFFCLSWLHSVYANGAPTPHQAYEIMRFFGVEGLHKSVAKVTTIMVEETGWVL